MSNRREFLRSLALVPLPLTLPWLFEKVEREPKGDAPAPPSDPTHTVCACGDFPWIEDFPNEGGLIRLNGPDERYEEHTKEACHKLLQGRGARCAEWEAEQARQAADLAQRSWEGD